MLFQQIDPQHSSKPIHYLIIINIFNEEEETNGLDPLTICNEIGELLPYFFGLLIVH